MGRSFAQMYDRVMWPLEKGKLHGVRKELISKAEGRVLEVGSGTGINFSYYPAGIRIDAVEPDPMMRNKSLVKLKHIDRQINTHLAGAENLPFEENTFDTVIATLVFCTIPDPVKALKELYRVSKPGAKMYLLEHVEMESRFASELQKRLTPAWKYVCGGCHLDRKTLEQLQASEWEVQHTASFYRGLFLSIEAVKNCNR